MALRKTRISKKTAMAELVRCTKDPEYYLLNYGYVRNPIGGHIKFKLYDYQKVCIQSFQENRFNITLKSRQTGLSTVTAGYIAWLMIFHKAREIVVVANKQKNAQGFIRKVKLIIKKSPPWMVPKIVSDNKGSIELSNGSMVTAEATTSDAARSESLSLLVIDEAAAIDTHKVNDLWGAAYPTLSLGGAAIIISTPKGVGNWYHKTWGDSQKGENSFAGLFIHWTEHPVYSVGTQWFCTDEMCKREQTHDCEFGKSVCEYCGEKVAPTSPWYREQCKQLGDPRLIKQELDCNFLGSGDNVIGQDIIDKLKARTKPPLSTDDAFDGGLWVWEDPQKESQYIIGADVARGDASDYSACHVVDLVTNEQVAEYKGQLPPDLYAKLLCELGKKYNDALLAVEANSIGYATCLKVVELGYPNIFYSQSGSMNRRDRRKLEKAYRNKENMIPGFQTTSANRPLIMSQLEDNVRNRTIKINSIRTATEFDTLIWNNGKPEAMAGYNDDLSMSLGILLLIKNTYIKDILANEAVLKASLESIGNSFGMESKDFEQLNKSFTNVANRNNPWVHTNSKSGEDEDLTWLIKK